jgi:hypothetical protein
MYFEPRRVTEIVNGIIWGIYYSLESEAVVRCDAKEICCSSVVLLYNHLSRYQWIGYLKD